MVSLTPLTIALLAGSAAAFPGMAGMREKAALLPRNPQATSTTSAAASSSSFPAWQAPGPDDGTQSCILQINPS